MTKKLSISIGQYSSAGRKPVNQDFHASLIPKEPLLAAKGIAVAIADGISSSDVSQIASETAIKNFIHDYYSTSDAWSVKTSAQRVLKAINSWLYSQTQHSAYRFNKDKGYICTFSAAVFKSNSAHLFNAGDSRIYRISDNQLEQLTIDHRRTVSAEVSYLTRGLGIHDQLEIDYHTIPVCQGDFFVLATDGVYEYLPEQVLIDAALSAAKGLSVGHLSDSPSPGSQKAVSAQSELDTLAKTLVTKAHDAGSTDNLTLQIIYIHSLPDQNLNEIQSQINQLPSAPKLQARKNFEGYTILRELYISSRSHVYLAQDIESETNVVIKTPSAEMKNDDGYLENFLMEYWIAKRINNPHVLKAIDETRKKNYLYTVTEYIEGKTLAQWMIDNPSPSIDIVRQIIEQIAKGLQAFHRQEMVHQDLRPNNVLIDSAGTVKIIDFGATKVAGISEIAKKNEGIVGTAQFTAPEYFVGHSGTNKSDIFSLGVIAYQMLCGALPYGTDIAKTHDMRSQQRLVYRPLPDRPGWLDYAIHKAVAIKPEKRYDEVSEFVHDIKQPSSAYIHQTKAPLIDRNPVLFWQSISVVLLCLLIYMSAK